MCHGGLTELAGQRLA
ncbi:hypothetical protein YPPY08_2931, partial [Yersinia pestis PY-08]